MLSISEIESENSMTWWRGTSTIPIIIIINLTYTPKIGAKTERKEWRGKQTRWSNFRACLWAAVKSQSMEKTSGRLDSFPSPTEGLRTPGSTTGHFCHADCRIGYDLGVKLHLRSVTVDCWWKSILGMYMGRSVENRLTGGVVATNIQHYCAYDWRAGAS